MDFLNILVEKMYDYAEAHSTSPTPVLQALERETHLKTLRPRMLKPRFRNAFLRRFKRLKIKDLQKNIFYNCYK